MGGFKGFQNPFILGKFFGAFRGFGPPAAFWGPGVFRGPKKILDPVVKALSKLGWKGFLYF